MNATDARNQKQMMEVQQEAEVHPKEEGSRAETDRREAGVLDGEDPEDLGAIEAETEEELCGVETAFPEEIASDPTELTENQLYSIHITFKYFTSEVSIIKKFSIHKKKWPKFHARKIFFVHDRRNNKKKRLK